MNVPIQQENVEKIIFSSLESGLLLGGKKNL